MTFATVWFAIPYGMDYRSGDKVSTTFVAEPTSRAIPTFRGTDAPVVAVVRRTGRGDVVEIPFRLVGGALFRPFGTQANLEDRGFFPSGSPFARETAPTLRLRAALPAADRLLTAKSFVACPYLTTSTPFPAPSYAARRGWRLDRDGRGDAEDAVTLACSRMAVVDGVLFHETRAPCWMGDPDRRHPRHVGVPDMDGRDAFGSIVDARWDPELMGLDWPVVPGHDSIEILEPGALPDTVDTDRIRMAASDVAEVLHLARVDLVERDLLRDALSLYDAAEANLVGRAFDAVAAERLVVSIASRYEGDDLGPDTLDEDEVTRRLALACRPHARIIGLSARERDAREADASAALAALFP